MTLNRLFITFGGSGLAPKAPGTVGSFVALIVGVALIQVIPLQTLFMLTFLITIAGIFEINKYEKLTNSHDDKSIVIDEVAGMWITLMFAIASARTMPYEYAYEISIILSFGAFRLFDIWKPSIIGTIDQKVKGGLGVMGDDIVAGFAGGMLTVLLLQALKYIL
jgi:phosphatidylglycerophosphatase A